MLSKGFVPLYRAIAEQPWYTDSIIFRVFVHLLLKASHKEHEVTFKDQRIQLREGQLITTVSILTRHLKIDSESKVKRALNKLCRLEEITKQNYLVSNRSKGQIITLVNWKERQKSVSPDVPPFVPPDVPLESLQNKALDVVGVLPDVPPDAPSNVQWNKNCSNKNESNKLKNNACHNKPVNQICHLEIRQKAFEHFWKCWSDNKKSIGRENTAPKSKTKAKFLLKMNESHVNKLGLDGFKTEINLICELASIAHKDIADNNGTNRSSDYYSYEGMYPEKYLSNEKWRESRAYKELIK
jgi:hypothetical protein